jgi:Stealth protein CR2, conserved region 2/Stealth protein CR1, conserved region 1/Stealth protein CR4, conserved region 4
MKRNLTPAQTANGEAIDIVYLWVDGNDPAWRLKRAFSAARLTHGQRARMATHGNVEGRFRDNDELRFSLRALERFFPGHGHVHLVTDGQVPHWLRDSDRLTVIDHKELIPAASLPTFDSGHIESYVHRIPNLSERFFYFNDDVFFGAPVQVDDWFFEGGSYAGWSAQTDVSDELASADAAATDNACRLSKQWFEARPHLQLGVEHSFRTFAHSPRPLLKSVLVALEKQLPELYAQSRSTVFRAWDQPSLICDFALRWGMSQDVTRVREYSHLYVSTGAEDASAQLSRLAASWGQVDFFCINDTTDDAPPNDPRLLEAREVLHDMFPRPSSFERHVHVGAVEARAPLRSRCRVGAASAQSAVAA